MPTGNRQSRYYGHVLDAVRAYRVQGCLSPAEAGEAAGLRLNLKKGA